MNAEMLSGNGSRSWAGFPSAVFPKYISAEYASVSVSILNAPESSSSTSAKENRTGKPRNLLKDSYIFNNNRHQTQMIPYCHFPLFHSKNSNIPQLFLLKDSDALHAIIHRRASVDVVFRVLRQVYPENERTPGGGRREGRNNDFLNTGLFLLQNQADALFMLPEQKQMIMKG